MKIFHLRPTDLEEKIQILYHCICHNAMLRLNIPVSNPAKTKLFSVIVSEIFLSEHEKNRRDSLIQLGENFLSRICYEDGKGQLLG